MTEQAPQYNAGEAIQAKEPDSKLVEILDIAVPAIQEIVQSFEDLSALRSRVELAKMFIWRDASGNTIFNQSEFETVWNAISGQSEPEKPAN